MIRGKLLAGGLFLVQRIRLIDPDHHAETGSLSAAAAELDYTPSGISRAVASLEESLGFSLLMQRQARW